MSILFRVDCYITNSPKDSKGFMQRVFYAVFAISAIKTGHTVSIKDLLIAPLLAGMDGAAVRAKGTPSLSTSDSTYKHAIGAVYNWIPPPRRAKPAAGEGWGGVGVGDIACEIRFRFFTGGVLKSMLPQTNP